MNFFSQRASVKRLREFLSFLNSLAVSYPGALLFCTTSLGCFPKRSSNNHIELDNSSHSSFSQSQSISRRFYHASSPTVWCTDKHHAVLLKSWSRSCSSQFHFRLVASIVFIFYKVALDVVSVQSFLVESSLCLFGYLTFPVLCYSWTT